MKETIFEQVAAAASALKLDLSAEEFALFAEDQELSEAGMEAVQELLSYLSEKKQQTTIPDFDENEPYSHKGTQDI